MNIFRFLGLPENHRAKRKITQHVKSYDKVPESKKVWPMWGQIKKDGVYALQVIINGESEIFSKTGKLYKNVGHLRYKLFLNNAFPTDGVYIAELCNDECSLETLSGIVNPNRKKLLDEDQEKLRESIYMAYHDYLTLDEFIQGHSNISYMSRYKRLENIVPLNTTLIEPVFLENEEEAKAFFKKCVDAGEEGIVLKQAMITRAENWLAGHKGYRMMKIVRGVSYDLRCMGLEEGQGKYEGKAVNLFFKWKNNKEIKAMLGEGWSHDDAKRMWEERFTARTVLGKIFEVYALQESSKGKLRLPKVGELRHDKSYSDV